MVVENILSIIFLMKPTIKINIAALSLAIFVTIATVYQKVELFNQTELDNLSCGWPMQYLSSSYSESRWDPPYPWTNSCVHFVGGLWGNSVDVQWTYFIYDIAIFYLLLAILVYSSRVEARKLRKKQ